jgi:hypothetical protein
MATKVATMATTKRERQKAARRQKLEQMERANKRRKMIRARCWFSCTSLRGQIDANHDDHEYDEYFVNHHDNGDI